MLERGGQWLTVSDYQEEAMLKAVTQLVMPGVVTEDEAEVAGHLADMGLDTPRATAQVRYQDGYGNDAGAGRRRAHHQLFLFPLVRRRWRVHVRFRAHRRAAHHRHPAVAVEQPALSKDLIDQVTLSRADGETAVLLSNDGDGHYTGLLVEPYQYPVDSEQAEALLTALSSFRLGTREAEANAETRAQYGLDDPELTLWIHQAAGTVGQVDENGQLAAVEVREQALRFVIGRAEGEFFYTCEYAGSCYLVSRFLLETLLAATPDTLVARQPADLGGAALSDILIESPLGDVHVTAQYTERVLPNNDIETDAEGNTVYDTAVTLNGRGSRRGAAYHLDHTPQRPDCIGRPARRMGPCPRTRRRAGASFSPRWAAPRVRSPPTRLDAFSDALAVDGVAIHYVHEEAIDLILADLLD